MIVNIRLEVTDEQRNALAQIIDGKPVKRLATRAEYNAAVAEFIAKLGQDKAEAEKPAPAPSYVEPREIEKHGTGIDCRTVSGQTLFHVNRAMFALADARRLEETGRRLRINDALDRVMDLREELVNEMAKEEAA